MAIESKGSQEVPVVPVVRVSEAELDNYLNSSGFNINIGVTFFLEQGLEKGMGQSASGDTGTSTSATGGTGTKMCFGDNGIANITQMLGNGMIIIGVSLPEMAENVKKSEEERPGQEQEL